MNTSNNSTFLITGISGFVGSSLAQDLAARGFSVYGFSRNPENISENIQAKVLGCDLLSPESLADCLATLNQELAPNKDLTLIHAATAANSDRQDKASEENTLNMARNLCAGLANWNKMRTGALRVIHLSSVAVYGEAGRKGPITPADIPRPADAYGRAKLEVETILANSNLEHYRVLRLAPVYNQKRNRNQAVRVFFPGLPLKLGIIPAPRHSLVHTDRLSEICENLIQEKFTGRDIQNATDKTPVSQNELRKLFLGPTLPLPRLLVAPLYYLLYLVPGDRGYRLRCFYWKLFRNNVYE